MRNKLYKILAAGFALAMAFTLSCSSGDDGNGDNNDSSSPSNGSNSSSSGTGGGDDSSGSSSPSNGNNSSSSGTGGGDDSSGSNSGPITETYPLTKTADQFTYTEVETSYRCNGDGTLETRTYNDENTINYSISNNVMVWKDRYAYEDTDTLNFKGTSNELMGAWARTRNKAASCGLRTSNMYCADCYMDRESGEKICGEYKEREDSWIDCKEGYDITEAVFTATSVKITRDYCPTEREIDGKDFIGWKQRIIDCNTMEYTKGADKATMKETENSFEVSYKGKTCKWSESSKSQRESACRQAVVECANSSDSYCYEERYYGILENELYDCMDRNNFPAELMGGTSCSDGGGSGGNSSSSQELSAKLLAKAKITPLFKKRN